MLNRHEASSDQTQTRGFARTGSLCSKRLSHWRSWPLASPFCSPSSRMALAERAVRRSWPRPSCRRSPCWQRVGVDDSRSRQGVTTGQLPRMDCAGKSRSSRYGDAADRKAWPVGAYKVVRGSRLDRRGAGPLARVDDAAAGSRGGRQVSDEACDVTSLTSAAMRASRWSSSLPPICSAEPAECDCSLAPCASG